MRVFLISLLVVGLLLPTTSHALNIPGLGGAFGGRIVAVQYCTCSFNLLLYIGPPKGGTFIFSPGISTLYKYYQAFRSGPETLGTSTGRGVCLQYTGLTCIPTGTGSIIRKIGTSLF